MAFHPAFPIPKRVVQTTNIHSAKVILIYVDYLRVDDSITYVRNKLGTLSGRSMDVYTWSNNTYSKRLEICMGLMEKN